MGVIFVLDSNVWRRLSRLHILRTQKSFDRIQLTYKSFINNSHYPASNEDTWVLVTLHLKQIQHTRVHISWKMCTCRKSHLYHIRFMDDCIISLLGTY